MNRTTASYGTRAFRSIGCLSSESDSLGFYGTGDLQPEKRLIFAVLLDAVECFQKYAGHEADRLFRDMEKWIFENDRELPFSFIIIISVKPWILTRSICGKVYCSGDKERSRNPIIAAERLSSGRIICRWGTDLLEYQLRYDASQFTADNLQAGAKT